MSIDFSSRPAALRDPVPDADRSVTCSAPSDLTSLLLTVLIQSRGAESDSARENINHANDLIEQARRQIHDAMARAAEADDKGNFWDDVSQVFGGDITTIAEVVASAALIAATGGVGTPAILALVATGLTLGADAGERLGLDPSLCAGLAVTGAVAGLFTGNLAGATGVWTEIALGARVAQGAAGAVGGGAHIAAGELHADAFDDRADATRLRGTQDDALFRFNGALNLLAAAARELARGETTISSIVQNDNDSRTALIARMGAA